MSAATHFETHPETKDRPEKRFLCRCTLQQDHTLAEYQAFYDIENCTCDFPGYGHALTCPEREPQDRETES